MEDKITINCHSSIRIEGDKIIYFDPFKIEVESHDADFIFITHNHYDHFEVESIEKLMKDETRIIVPNKMAIEALGSFNPRNIVGVDPDEFYEIAGIKIETISSYNVNKNFHPKESGWVGYIVTLNDERIYVAGDTDITNENINVSCDIALIPIGGTYTMNYLEGAELVNKIKPEVVIPTHYGCIVGDLSDGEKFKELINNEVKCLLLIK